MCYHPKTPSPFQIKVKVDIKTKEQNKVKVFMLRTFSSLSVNQLNSREGHPRECLESRH